MQNVCVMICDDNLAISTSLSGYFEEEHMSVITATTGAEALRFFEEGLPDIIILDVMLPDMSGRDVCTAIRKTSDVPIIFLSAKSQEIDRIIGLEIGADDYVTKPFSPMEVVLRAKKLLQRHNKETAEKLYQVGELRVYPESYEAFIGNDRLKLTTKEFSMLKYLAAHSGKAMTREHILNAVWGNEYIGEPRVIDTLIKRLRHKIFEDHDPSVLHFDIVTIFGVGYKIEESESWDEKK